MGDIHPIVSEIRVRMLIRAITDFNHSVVSLDEFIAPAPEAGIVLNPRMVDKWMRIMYPVVGELGSRFSSPCRVVSKRYRHLLRHEVEATPEQEQVMEAVQARNRELQKRAHS